MKKKEILWISLCAPYDSVAHGGGKTHNFYLKEIHKRNEFDINLISFCDLDEYERASNDLKAYGIKHTLIPWTHEINFHNIKRKMQLLDFQFNPFNKYGGGTNVYYLDQVKRCVREKEYRPDIVILQWTEIVLFLPEIKKIFPSAFFVAIEEDVKFLAHNRKVALAQTMVKKSIAKFRYYNLKNREVGALRFANLIFTYSKKDKDLLTVESIKNVHVLSPYFENYNMIERTNKPIKDILFYGAMSRKDNYDSAIWFIENVFQFIEDEAVRFVIIGSKPVKKLYEYVNDRILVTGFVPDVVPYFQKSLCLVAPLLSGAGVKIKILEALSAGIPVLTNNIGIEGIMAKPFDEYIHCETKDDYICTINNLLNGEFDTERIGLNAKKRIATEYNLHEDVVQMSFKLKTIANQEDIFD